MQETPPFDPESLESLRPQFEQELLKQLEDYEIESIDDLFAFLEEDGEFLEPDEIFDEIFSYFQGEKDDRPNLDANTYIQGAVENFIVSYVWAKQGGLMFADETFGEKQIRTAETLSPDQLMIEPEIAAEIKAQNIQPHDLSILSIGGNQLQIDGKYLKGIPMGGHFDEGVVDFGQPMIDVIGKKLGDRERMLKLYATILKWQEEHGKTVDASGKILP